MVQCPAGEQILEISGILNGTTNFILSKMDREGQTFEEALKRLRSLDMRSVIRRRMSKDMIPRRKITDSDLPLHSEKEVNYEEVYTEGITKITDTDFKYAAKMGTSIKLLKRPHG